MKSQESKAVKEEPLPTECIKCGLSEDRTHPVVFDGPRYNYDTIYPQKQAMSYGIADYLPFKEEYLQYNCCRCGYPIKLPCKDAK